MTRKPSPDVMLGANLDENGMWVDSVVMIPVTRMNKKLAAEVIAETKKIMREFHEPDALSKELEAARRVIEAARRLATSGPCRRYEGLCCCFVCQFDLALAAYDAAVQREGGT